MNQGSLSPAPRRRRKPLTEQKRFEDEGSLFVVFSLATERYGVSIDFVQEILKPRNITEIPHTPEYLAGVLNLRGRIVPVVDLRRKLGMAPRPATRATRIMVTLLDDLTLGMIVDEVVSVRPISQKRIEPAPPMISGAVDSAGVTGLAKIDDTVVTLLDLKEILRRTDAPDLPNRAAEHAGNTP